MNAKLCKKMRKAAKFYGTEANWKNLYKKWKKEQRNANA